MHMTCFLKFTDISEIMRTRKDMLDVDNLTMDQSLWSICATIVCIRFKGNINIRKLKVIESNPDYVK